MRRSAALDPAADRGALGPVTIETARLRLEPARESDFDALHVHYGRPEVKRYLWDDEAPSRELVAQVLGAGIALWRTRGLGYFAIRLRGAQRVIGSTGFKLFEGGDDPELLYSLDPDLWGRGLAHEAVRACLRFAFEERGAIRVWAATDPPNAASLRVMERAGLRFVREGSVGEKRVWNVICAIERADFRPDLDAPYRVERV
jgi:ribosomal-protein-alanine N-acetyltransferase